jgi:hypothetical protein
MNRCLAEFFRQFIGDRGGDFATLSGSAQCRPDWPRVEEKIAYDEVDVYDGFGA